jgi:outer membrane protein
MKFKVAPTYLTVVIAASLLIPLRVARAGEAATTNDFTPAEDQTLRLDLAGVLLRAAEFNFQVRQARERVNEATGSFKTERSMLLPKLSGMVSQNRQERSTAAFGLPESSIATIPDAIPFDINYPGLSPNLIKQFNLPTEGFTQVTEPIEIDYENSDTTGPYSFFSANMRLGMALLDRAQFEDYKTAKIALNRSDLEVELSREDAMSTAAQLFYSVLVQQKSIEALEGKIDLHLDKLEEIKDLLTTGTARPLDVKKEEVSLASAQNSLLDAQRKKAGALRELKRQLDIPLDSDFELIGDLYFQAVDIPPPHEALTNALEQRIDVKLQNFREKIAGMQRDAAKFTRWPVVRGFGSYGRQGNYMDDTVDAWMIGAFASIPIWDSYERTGKIEVKESQYQQVRYDGEDLTRAVASELELLRDEINFTASTVELAEQSVDYLDENRQYMEDKVTAGTGKRIDLLSAEVDLAQAEFKLIEAIYNHEIARVKWFKSIGQLEEIARP